MIEDEVEGSVNMLLTGKDAKKFAEKIKNPEKISKEKYRRAMITFLRVKRGQTYQYPYQYKISLCDFECTQDFVFESLTKYTQEQFEEIAERVILKVYSYEKKKDGYFSANHINIEELCIEMAIEGFYSFVDPKCVGNYMLFPLSEDVCKNIKNQDLKKLIDDWNRGDFDD